MAWFIVVWDIDGNTFHGPYENQETVMDILKTAEHEETERVAIIGPIPMTIIK